MANKSAKISTCFSQPEKQRRVLRRKKSDILSRIHDETVDIDIVDYAYDIVLNGLFDLHRKGTSSDKYTNRWEIQPILDDVYLFPDMIFSVDLTIVVYEIKNSEDSTIVVILKY